MDVEWIQKWLRNIKEIGWGIFDHIESEWELNCKANRWKKRESRGTGRLRKSWLNGVVEKERWEQWHLCATEREKKYLSRMVLILSPVAFVHFSSINHNYVSKFHFKEVIEIKFFIEHFRQIPVFPF